MSGNDGLPLFHGDDKMYPEWLRAFKAYCKIKKCKQALTLDEDMPESDNTAIPETEVGKRQQAAKDRNDLAMALLTQALRGDTLSVYIDGSETLEWPDGLA